MKNIFALVFVAVFVLSCAEQEQGGNLNHFTPDIVDTIADILQPPIINPLPPISTLVPDECTECKWYFCPPLNEVWQQEICMNICVYPPTVISESGCVEHLECNPLQLLIETIECTTDEGYPGTQDKLCNKGRIQYTNCETECTEESCNYYDDDCDGLIDEEQLNICGDCGIVPPEVCDNIDNNCNGDTDEDLIRTCATACGTGYELCDSGNWSICSAPQPSDEICDGLDNDCDGQIDEELECICTVQDVGVLFPCREEPLLCGEGFKTCECLDDACTDIAVTSCYALCHWFPPADPSTCDPLVGQIIEQEECNNFDENCNQLIDEDLLASCYSGPPGTLMQGICIPGTMTCEAGEWGSYYNEQFTPSYCDGEITPQEEICNGLDDNCDGETDYGEEMKETDILFVIDWSGSMNDEITAVLTALNQFAQNYSDEDVLKWGVVRGPLRYTVGPPHEHLELTHNLSGFSDFLSTMSNLSVVAGMNTTMEMLIDAVYLAIYNITSTLPVPIEDLLWKGTLSSSGYGSGVKESVPPLKDFKINWRPDVDRVIIVFSDERPQSYLHPPISVNQLEAALVATPRLKLYTFSQYSFWSWDELAIATGGKDFQLTNNPTEMYNSLMEILDEICKDGQE